ncbi:GNAT family N-acetyltransferase [Paraglaciecola sp. 2405UD69-4]|uniref:GNAT family N-acetyltransferase n=1 Tax=Paraglaciecola sp. 2405UD69-4 TaxID=3391836 RepID=UPI0039C8D3CA
MFTFKFFTSIESIGQSTWDAFAEKHSPFCHYSFLHSLEATGCTGGKTGWHPQHVVIYQNLQAVGILPLYKKTHSYGEYVFDFAWANTYREYGLNYYPKLVSAIPYTPVTGARLMTSSDIDESALITALCDTLQQHLKKLSISSMHWLFVDKLTSECLAQNNQLQRLSVQFQWFNKAYTSFDNYLSHFNSRKRKSVKKERLKISEQDVTVQRKHGSELTEQDMQFFYHCYRQTYLKRSGHSGYLTSEFFQEIFSKMQNNLMLVMAYREQQPIASALFIFDNNQLCGRYWGALEEVSSLHFECCYYQGIEFCIEKGIKVFNPGTQGEHKILRGFEPIYCYSNHHLAELAFHDAVAKFIDTESKGLEQYKAQAEQLLPFKKE